MSLRQSLLKAIETLKKEVVKMSDLVLDNIKLGLKAFKEGDLVLAKEVIERDEIINQYEESIAKLALKIIWKEQPVASDLRFVTAILKLITDLERIGDHASDIASMTLHLENTRSQRLLPITTQMAETVEKMLLNSIDALINVNAELAKKIILEDDIVDDLFNKLIAKISKGLKEENLDANEGIYVLMVAKYLERVGDHTVNIAEWIIFMVKGTHKDTSLF